MSASRPPHLESPCAGAARVPSPPSLEGPGGASQGEHSWAVRSADGRPRRGRHTGGAPEHHTLTSSPQTSPRRLPPKPAPPPGPGDRAEGRRPESRCHRVQQTAYGAGGGQDGELRETGGAWVPGAQAPTDAEPRARAGKAVCVCRGNFTTAGTSGREGASGAGPRVLSRPASHWRGGACRRDSFRVFMILFFILLAAFNIL